MTTKMKYDINKERASELMSRAAKAGRDAFMEVLKNAGETMPDPMQVSKEIQHAVHAALENQVAQMTEEEARFCLVHFLYTVGIREMIRVASKRLGIDMEEVEQS